MANFDTHLIVGATVSLIVSETLITMEILSPSLALSAFFLGTLGSLMPDMDSNYSKSIKVSFTMISILFTMLLVSMKSQYYSLIELLIISIAIFSAIRFGVIELLRGVSKHRGMFHSIPVALIWGMATAIISNVFFKFNPLISWIYGFMIIIGYITHLTLDEIYSVDLANKKIKKSFGTALKLFKFKTPIDRIQTILIYIILVLLIQISPTITPFRNALFSNEAIAIFINILLPYDGKWFIH
ncbi:MAG: metal-dependent hydrolase [Sulfurovum sp.]|nr:metal-dependent hydrolase [Sulfurovaceae bacterium]